MQNGHRNNQPQDLHEQTKCSKNMQNHMHTSCKKEATTTAAAAKLP